MRSFGCAFFVLWEEKAMIFDLHKFVSEAEEKTPETVSDSSGAILTPGKPVRATEAMMRMKSVAMNVIGSLPASRNIVI